jgi:hypothetical protein
VCYRHMIFVPLTRVIISDYPAQTVRRVLVVLIATLTLIAPIETTAARPPRPESALDLLQIPWQKLGYQIVFMSPQPGFRAMTLPGKHRIEVYVRPQDDVDLLAYDIAHELGHAIDVTYNTAETRRQWMQARGINPGTAWFGCDRCSDYNTPAGDFAETFALVLCGPKYFRSRIAGKPTAEQIAALVQFFPKEFLPS